MIDDKDQINELKCDEELIANYMEHSAGDDTFWFDKSTLFKDLNISKEYLEEVIENSDLIVMNSNGELTTRKLYKKRTAFTNRLFNAINNKIT